ncbi:hypothetical protein K413DRAFT_2574 [Clostridium sp. ASBs410]|nr:hypothetical protein K413DRAFT_2574 [Clostridium sp. ASBs410]
MRFKDAVGLYKKCEQAASDLTGRTRVNMVQMLTLSVGEKKPKQRKGRLLRLIHEMGHYYSPRK